MHVYFNSCVNNTRNNTRKKLTYAGKKGKGFPEEVHICPCMSKVERNRLVMTSTSTTTTPWGYGAQMSCCYRSQEKMKPQHDAIKFKGISCFTEGGNYLQVVYLFNNVIWSYVSVRQPVGTNKNRLTGTVLRNSNTSNWKQLTEPVPLTPQGTLRLSSPWSRGRGVFFKLVLFDSVCRYTYLMLQKNIEGLHIFFSQRRVQKVKKQKSK